MTKELLDKLSGGKKADLLIDVLTRDEMAEIIADYTSELRALANDTEATEPKVEVKSEPNSQVDPSGLFSVRSNDSEAEAEDRLFNYLMEFKNENVEASSESEGQDATSNRYFSIGMMFSPRFLYTGETIWAQLTFRGTHQF